MTSIAPVSVALKFGFLVVLYLFLLWVVRSARRDLGGVREEARAAPRPTPSEATGLYSASGLARAGAAARAAHLVVERAPGHDSGMIYDLDGDLVLGRGDRAEIRLQDPFASARHARVYEQGGVVVIEDLGSTNGTYVNAKKLASPVPLHPGDRLQVGRTVLEVGP
jgi:hypothetical protein